MRRRGGERGEKKSAVQSSPLSKAGQQQRKL